MKFLITFLLLGTFVSYGNEMDDTLEAKGPIGLCPVCEDVNEFSVDRDEPTTYHNPTALLLPSSSDFNEDSDEAIR